MIVHDFNESIKAGEAGEENIVKYLNNLEHIKEVVDLRPYKKYRDKDIDLGIVFKNGAKTTVEVKTDSYTTPNLFYEAVSCLETNSLGCMEKTQADYIFYYYPNLDVLYMIKTKEFREWVKDNADRFQEKYIKNKRYNGGQYTSFGYLIPRDMIANEFPNVKIDVTVSSKIVKDDSLYKAS